MRTYKLLLLQPPVQDFYDTPIRLQPLGLCSLKAAVRKFLPEWTVIVKDYHHSHGKRTISLPKELTYLREFYAGPDKSPFSTFYHYYHFGASFEEIASEVTAEQPDIVGISALFSPYYREVLACAQAIKQQLDVPILVGGSHVSADPEGMLQHPYIDFVIRGEGERPLVEFLQTWQAGANYADVPNLGWKRQGELVLNPLAPNYPIDELPMPDFSDFPPERYQFERRPLCFLLMSRGCPYHCDFCSVHLTFGETYRKHSVEAVFREIQQRYAAGYRVFDFEDDNLSFDREAVTALCEQLIAGFPKGAIELLAMNGLSYLSLDDDLLRLMKDAGFSHLNLSLVSVNAEVMRQLHRPHSVEHFWQVVQAGARLGFEMVSYQILGLPQESLESMIHTLVFQTELPVLLGASPFYLTPNCPIARSFPPLSDTEVIQSRLTALGIETPFCRRDEVFTLFVTTRILNFLKGVLVSKETVSFDEALTCAEQQGGRTAIGAILLRRLFDEQRLYAWNNNIMQPVERFQSDLFFRVWQNISSICTQTGRNIFP